MSMFGGKDLEFSYDGHDITPYVQTWNGISIEDLMADAKAFGDVFNASVPTGDKNVDDIVLGGLYDDAANTPATLFDTANTAPDPNDTPKDLVVTLGGTNVRTIPVHPKKFVIKGTRNTVHEYEATLTKGAGDITVAP